MITDIEKAKEKEYLLNKAKALAGNDFNLKKTIQDVRKAIEGKNVQKLYFGFNPASYDVEIVAKTEEGYIFIPMKESITLVGGCMSHLVYLRLYYAQKKLSSFLSSLSKSLNIPVEDRCLYIAYLSHDFNKENFVFGDSWQEKVSLDLCLEKQKKFREQYATQLEELKGFDSWVKYYNNGFEFHYASSVAIDHAINEIYKSRDELEKNGDWEEAKKTIQKLRKMI